MNLSLTPLSEAYNIPKKQTPNMQRQNVHVDPHYQKKVLKESNQAVNNAIPNGYHHNQQSYMQYIPAASETTSTSKIPEEKQITLNIKDPELVEKLSVYKEDYVIQLLKANLLKEKTVETFISSVNPQKMSEDLDGNVILVILAVILIVDIILRIRFKI